MTPQKDDFYIQRTVTLPRTSKVTEELIQQLDHMLEYASGAEYRDTLIELYHSYIMKECDSLPDGFTATAGRMYFLIEFLGRVK